MLLSDQDIEQLSKEELKTEVKRLNQLINDQPGYQTFKDLFHESSDLYYILNDKDEFIDVNQSVVDKYGYAKEEIIGKTPVFFAAEGMNDLEKVRDLMKKVRKKGIAVKLEWWSKTKDGSIFPKELILRKGKYFGKERVIGLGRDITERKNTEQQLIAKNSELEKLNKELDAFVYSASHDLKAPLASILGLVELIKMEGGHFNAQYIDLIKTSVVKLNEFVEDLVEYSRSSRAEIAPKQVQIKEVIDDCFENLKHMHEANKVKMTVDCRPSDQVFTDPARVKIILNNLVSNAIKYSKKQNSRSFIKVSAQQNGSGVSLQVEDNGVGIPKKYQGQIFDMFFRANEDQSKGSGLGLYIVKEAIEKLNGTIEVESKYNMGTAVKVYLPNLD